MDILLSFPSEKNTISVTDKKAEQKVLIALECYIR